MPRGHRMLLLLSVHGVLAVLHGHEGLNGAIFAGLGIVLFGASASITGRSSRRSSCPSVHPPAAPLLATWAPRQLAEHVAKLGMCSSARTGRPGSIGSSVTSNHVWGPPEATSDERTCCNAAASWLRRLKKCHLRRPAAMRGQSAE